MKQTTIRLPAEQLATLELVADAEQSTVAEVVRRAVDDYLDALKTDPDFRSTLAVVKHRYDVIWNDFAIK